MKKTFYTKTGEEERELTDAEVTAFAARGDDDCKREILRKEKQTAGNLQARIEAIEKFLGV